jgi:IrrE N-terminal-like domain
MVGKPTEAVNEATFETNLAQRVVARFSLSPPVDVAMVAQRYADVHYSSIPFRVDGICLDLKRPGKRPTIIINFDQPRLRKRFTLAHELGHVLIPWHRGSLYDDFSMFDADTQFDRWEMEGEANRFASELLMPSTWASAVLQSADSFGAAVSSVQDTADVSTIASVIRLVGLAPPNHLFAYCDSDGVVLNAGRSLGTVANSPAWNQELDPDYLNRNATDRGEILVGSSCLHWWRLADAVALSPTSDSREWREILNEILNDLNYLYSDRHHTQQSINGIIGSTNSRMRTNAPEELLAALIQRFDSKIAEGGVFLELPHHPKFRDFLARRVGMLRRPPT